MGIAFKVTADAAESLPCLHYGSFPHAAFSIPDAGLLWEKKVQEINIPTGEWKNIPTLFAAGGASIPFDIFSAIFFLLSRYEEHLPFEKDKHQRFPHTASILFKNGWQERPLVDEWVYHFGEELEKQLSIPVQKSPFQLHLTYDIDIAFAYRGKGFLRNAGGLLRDVFLNRTFSAATERFKVLSGRSDDPFDSFPRLEKLHRQLKKRPYFFVLAALKTSAFDKNISPDESVMKQLVKMLESIGSIALHPSYKSNQQKVFFEEKTALENITGHSIFHSRQHYIRLQIPATYLQLMQAGITDDYTMGYGAAIGFRAGTGRSFFWYDLENEKQQPLRIHPFAFMDTASRFGNNMNAENAFSALEKMTDTLQKTGSEMTTVFHNFSLGTDSAWEGWWQAYERFVRDFATS